MTQPIRSAALLALAMLLAACAGQGPFAPRAAAAPAPEPPSPSALSAPPPRPAARTVDELDTTTPAQRAAAAAARPGATAGRELGRTVASLGNPTEPGFWARTPLVSAPTRGRLVWPQTGASVQVELIPRAGDPGAGSQVSLPALRLLGVPLTALPELVVYAD